MRFPVDAAPLRALVRPDTVTKQRERLAAARARAMRHPPPHIRSLALPSLLLLLLLPSARGWSYTIEDAADVVCTGGAGFSKYGGK